MEFEHEGVEVRYTLEYHNKMVIREEFREGERVLLRRGEGGIGEIFAECEGKNIAFQTPQDEIAVATRRDSLQHSYLEPLYQWASKVLFYHFASSLGRERVFIIGQGSILPSSPIDLRNDQDPIAIYNHGWEKFGEDFDQAIREDMLAIGYVLDDVASKPLVSFQVGMPGTPFGLAIKEKDLSCDTEQPDISNGMFRDLSLFILLNYATMSKYPSCILVDDIGEGLDYTRSCSLLERLMLKTSQAGVQLVMSTNDRFVMNIVPLEAWSVLQRSGGHVTVFNYENSKQVFDDFKFCGLNNFDFFAYDYLNDETGEEEARVETGNLC